MKRILLTALLGALTACGAKSPDLTPPEIPAERPVHYEKTANSAATAGQTLDTRVDILFVIDDSDSMRDHVKLVGNNMRLFANEIAKIKTIDFHIGYTTVFDQKLADLGYQVCKAGTDRAGERNFDDAGTLGPLKGPAPQGRRFVTRNDDFVGVLSSTFTPDLIKTYREYDPRKPNFCPSGTENEESFAPLLAVLNPNLPLNAKNGPNAGFLRPGANFVAIIVSDAKDEGITRGAYSVDQVYDQIKRLTGSTAQRKKARIFAVAVKPKSMITKNRVVHYGGHSCTPDPAFADPTSYKDWDKAGKYISHLTTTPHQIKDDENPLAALAKLSGDDNETPVDQVISICNPDYGAELAKFAAQIQKDAIRDTVIKLSRPPQQFLQIKSEEERKNQLTVLVGGAPLDKSLWRLESLNGVFQVVIPAASLDFTKIPPGTQVSASYVGVDVGLKTSKPL